MISAVILVVIILVLILYMYFEWQNEQTRIEQQKFIGSWEVLGGFGDTQILIDNWIFYENLSVRSIINGYGYFSPSITFSSDTVENSITVVDIEDKIDDITSDWGKYKIENGKLKIYNFKNSNINGRFEYDFTNKGSIALESDFSSKYYVYGHINLNKISYEKQYKWEDINITVSSPSNIQMDSINLLNSSTSYYGASCPSEWGKINIDDKILFHNIESYIIVSLNYIDTDVIIEKFYFGDFEKNFSNEHLISYLDFNEGYGSEIYDKKNIDINGKIYGATWVSGISGYALHFDGINDYILINNLNHDTTAFSISLWFKRDGSLISHSESLISKGTSSYRKGYNLVINENDSLIFSIKDGDFVYKLFSIKKINDLDWHHVVAVWNGNTMYIYIDGVLDISEYLGSIHIVNDPKSLEIGNHYGAIDNYHPFHGIIDEICIYNKALDSEEIEIIHVDM